MLQSQLVQLRQVRADLEEKLDQQHNGKKKKKKAPTHAGAAAVVRSHTTLGVTSHGPQVIGHHRTLCT